MKRIYEAAAYASSSDDGCYWRTTIDDARAPYPNVEDEITCDFVVVGAGFTGLSAALHLAERDAGRIVVLDAKTPGWGASGRNGGFACIGGEKSSTRALRKRYGQEDVALYHQSQRASIDLVAELIEKHGIIADTHSNGETLLAHRPKDVAGFQDYADLLQADFGVKAQIIRRDELAEHGMNSPRFHGAITSPLGFALNPRKYVLGLAHAALDAGVEIYTQSPTTKIGRSNTGDHLITCPKGLVRAKTLLLATNGYSSENIPDWFAARYLPVQSNIIVTREMSESEIEAQGWTSDQMSYDTRNLLHYFRLMPNRRFLFGMRGSTRTTQTSTAKMKRDIRRDFEAMFPEWSAVETPHFWAGLVCLSRNLTPYAGPIADWPNAYTALAYHGNGVAMGTYAGSLLADMATGTKSRIRIPGLMQAPLRKFPLGRWRRAILPPAYSWYALMDRG
ncbi:NAD(P)/FAD-dependent oxidoreductase [Pseudohalocynthiibacter aestuariivivens]|uniref:NAD(P)/FAD-dependent oxidoreductase n=1 Tax=Pseudohalocynthiibacter aestuariivivens TaxID=1591409 RepID=A0ABV5JFC2_9RHOB|nr:FAD-dependent oxidoreductase [Pseudohalocynthiibacter aestuariivivens]MBS9717825.1 FAD-binding oxidoreductase [Pseudohalocynthiibacter aestuariivivens]